MAQRALQVTARYGALLLMLFVACGDEVGGPGPILEISGLAPTAALAGTDAVALTVFGSGFSRNSEIVFNSAVLPTTFRSPTELTATLGIEQLALAGVFFVTVRMEDAASSNAESFTVENPVPTITGIDPSSVVLRSDTLTVSLSGAGFVESSVVLIDGSLIPRPEFVSPNLLTAEIPSTRLSELRTLFVSVKNGDPGGGTSASLPFEITLDPAITSYRITGIPANDILYDEVRQVLYASVSGVHPTIPNTIATIQPGTGTVLSTIPVGSEPGPLALSQDGRFLFTGLKGAPRVERIDLTSQTVDLVIPLGQDDFFGPMYAGDLACIPGQPESVAVSRYYAGYTPGHAGVVLFDGADPRPFSTTRTRISNRIEASDSAERIYGYDSETSEFALREILVTESGLTEGAVWNELVEGFAGFDYDIAYEAGRIYGLGGVVVDAATGVTVGAFDLDEAGPAAPDAANDRVHFIASGPEPALTLRSFSLSAYESVGSYALPPTSPSPWRVVRWGDDGLAYPTAEGLVLLRAAFVSP